MDCKNGFVIFGTADWTPDSFLSDKKQPEYRPFSKLKPITSYQYDFLAFSRKELRFASFPQLLHSALFSYKSIIKRDFPFFWKISYSFYPCADERS